MSNGGGTSRWKFQEQLALKSHSRAVIQQPTPRSFETVKVHKIELEKALRDAKGPREC